MSAPRRPTNPPPGSTGVVGTATSASSGGAGTAHSSCNRAAPAVTRAGTADGARSQQLTPTRTAPRRGTPQQIPLYPVPVMAGHSALLPACATDSTKYFALPTSGQIVTAFNQIGTSLTKLRIAK